MFVETCCPKCGKNSAYIRNYSYNIKTFSSCNNCGGFSFIPGFHNFNRIVEDKSVIIPTPAGIRCLDYKNLVNTTDFLNRSLKFFRGDVNLLAAAYSYYCYGESNAYKAILDLDSNKINLTALPILSMHKDVYFMDKEDIDILRRNMMSSEYYLIRNIYNSNMVIGLSNDDELYLYYYVCYLTLLKLLDGYEEPIAETYKAFLTRVVRNSNNIWKIDKHICSKFSISYEKWFETMSLFVHQ